MNSPWAGRSLALGTIILSSGHLVLLVILSSCHPFSSYSNDTPRTMTMPSGLICQPWTFGF
ncbi:MAG: hypothetical protein R2932_37110, partial [Caldilineaceae bacterium]